MIENRAPGGNTDPLSGLSGILVYPNCKDVAFASLGFLKVAGLLGRRIALSDFTYLPAGRDRDVLSKTKGLLLGRTSQIEARRFDIIAFSVSYENDFAHMPELLMLAGIPPLASERHDLLPIVLSGGFTMSSNPLPIADFIDAAVVGEAEPVIDSLLSAVGRAKAGEVPKRELLEHLVRIEGIYVPSLGEKKVKRIWSAVGNIAPEAASPVSSHFGEMFLVEVGRGCARGCLFCAAGNLYRPVRTRTTETVLEHAAGHESIGLVGTAVGDHPDIVPIMEQLARDGRTVGVSSLRPDQITARVADLIARCGVKTISIAPETGSDLLRRKIGKRITRQQIVDAVSRLSVAGIRTIKLYFMIGLPGETDQDAESIVSLVSDLAAARGRSRLAVAVGPFVPKPHTAFQWCPLADRGTLSRRIKVLKAIRRIPGCSLKVGSVHEAWTEAVLARGDRSLSRLLLEAADKGLPLRTVLKRGQVPDPHRELDRTKPLPWDFIDSDVSRERLLRLLEESRTT